MLILTRSIGQTIKIGNEVTVTVLGTQGMQVKLGIEAPKHVAVHREEIFRRIELEKAKRNNNGDFGEGISNG